MVADPAAVDKAAGHSNCRQRCGARSRGQGRGMVARPAAVDEVAGRPDMGGVIKKAAERHRDAMNEAAGWHWGCRRR